MKNGLYQVGTLRALMLGLYDGDVSALELSLHGNVGIGTFDGVFGELIMVDGTVYRAVCGGNASPADGCEMLPFAVSAYIPEDTEVQTLGKIRSLDELKTALGESALPRFVRIECVCESIKLRSLPKQTKPYRTLVTVQATDEVRCTLCGVRGTLVGLYCPPYLEGVNAVGWHFHFITDGRDAGGHVLDLAADGAEVQSVTLTSFHAELPPLEAMSGIDLTRDISGEIKTVEG